MAFRDNRSGGRRDFGRRSFGGDRGGSRGGDRGGDREMFQATCSSCGKECQVPFRPTGSKPVYCSDCFRTMGGGSDSRRDDRGPRRSGFGDRDSRPRSDQPQPQNNAKFDELNAKLDKILAMLGSNSPAKAVKIPVEPMPKVTIETEVPQAVSAPEVVETPVQSEEPAIPEKKKRAPKKVSTPVVE